METPPNKTPTCSTKPQPYSPQALFFHIPKPLYGNTTFPSLGKTMFLTKTCLGGTHLFPRSMNIWWRRCVGVGGPSPYVVYQWCAFIFL